MSKPVVNIWRRFIPISLTCLMLSTSVSVADDQPGAGLRWFDIEVLVFKQDGHEHTTPEYFPLDVRPVRLQRYHDILSAYHQAQFEPMVAMFPTCDDTADNETYTALSAWLPGLTSVQRSAQPLFVQQQMSRQPLCRDALENALLTAWYSPSGSGARPSTSTVIDGQGGNKFTSTEPFLLNTSEHELTRVRQQLERQSGKQTLLHTTWRQPVFSRNQGRKIRLFGGQNFTHEYDYFGFAKEDHQPPYEWTQNPDILYPEYEDNEQSSQPFERIYALIDLIEAGRTPFGRPDTQADGLPQEPQNRPSALPDDVWEFDGLMHIYLVGNYLHIEGEFNLREEVHVPLPATSLEAQAEAALRDEDREADFLRAYHFNQLRRVISHQTHYFDHPKFGIIVQIRRTELSGRR